jgi:hypothetical protein
VTEPVVIFGDPPKPVPTVYVELGSVEPPPLVQLKDQQPLVLFIPERGPKGQDGYGTKGSVSVPYDDTITIDVSDPRRTFDITLTGTPIIGFTGFTAELNGIVIILRLLQGAPGNHEVLFDPASVSLGLDIPNVPLTDTEGMEDHLALQLKWKGSAELSRMRVIGYARGY